MLFLRAYLFLNPLRLFSKIFYRKKICARNLSNLSYQHNPSSNPLQYLTYGDILDKAVSRYPQKTAIISTHQNIRKTFQEFRYDVHQVSAGLVSLGLQKEDRVALMSFNCYEWVVSQFALACAGFQMVAINPVFTQNEVANILKKTACKAMVIGESYQDNNFYQTMTDMIPGLANKNVNEPISSSDFPNLKHLITFHNEGKPGAMSLEDLMKRGNCEESRENFRVFKKHVVADDCVNIQLTSGTTGSPKAVKLSHHMLINNALSYGRALAITKFDRICAGVPLFHCSGNVLGTTAMVCYQASIVLPGPSFDPQAVLEVIDLEKCTVIVGPPSIFIDLLNHEDLANCSFNTLRGGVIGANNCSKELMKDVHTKMKMRDICIAYGSTENSPLISMTTVNQPLNKRISTVGTNLEHIEIKLIDKNGQVVKRGEEGEICCRGYQVMLEYLDDPERTNKVIGSDRWFKTGDLGIMDDEGYLKIAGRIKDIIIKGNENIYPREIEEILQLHPDVAEAQVFGIPDERFGELICAWIRAHSNKKLETSDMRKFCMGMIADFKIPTHFHFVKKIPKNQSGKVLKKVMVEETMKSLGEK